MVHRAALSWACGYHAETKRNTIPQICDEPPIHRNYQFNYTRLQIWSISKGENNKIFDLSVIQTIYKSIDQSIN